MFASGLASTTIWISRQALINSLIKAGRLVNERTIEPSKIGRQFYSYLSIFKRGVFRNKYLLKLTTYTCTYLFTYRSPKHLRALHSFWSPILFVAYNDEEVFYYGFYTFLPKMAQIRRRFIYLFLYILHSNTFVYILKRALEFQISYIFTIDDKWLSWIHRINITLISNY